MPSVTQIIGVKINTLILLKYWFEQNVTNTTTFLDSSEEWETEPLILLTREYILETLDKFINEKLSLKQFPSSNKCILEKTLFKGLTHFSSYGLLDITIGGLSVYDCNKDIDNLIIGSEFLSMNSEENNIVNTEIEDVIKMMGDKKEIVENSLEKSKLLDLVHHKKCKFYTVIKHYY